MAETKASRADRRRAAATARKGAAQQRPPGQPEITLPPVEIPRARHLTSTCAGCVFWDTTDTGLGPSQGVCRGDLPQLVSVGSPNGNVLQALWPVTDFSATCGVHMTPEEYANKKRAERIAARA